MVNLDVLSKLEEMGASQRDSKVIYVKQQDIPVGGRLVFRMFPPKGGMATYAQPLLQHWFKCGDGKICITSPKSIGEEYDRVEQLINYYRTNGDAAVKSWLSQRDNYQNSTVFLIPGFVLDEVQYGLNGEITNYTIRDGKPAVLQVTVSILKAINNHLRNPEYNPVGTDGILDFTHGFPITISKTEFNKKTDYQVSLGRHPLPIGRELFDISEDQLISVKKRLYTPEYIDKLFTYALSGNRPKNDEPQYMYPELREEDSNTAPAVTLPPAPPIMSTQSAPAKMQTPTVISAEVPSVTATPSTQVPPIQSAPQPVPPVAPATPEMTPPQTHVPPVSLETASAPTAPAATPGVVGGSLLDELKNSLK